MPVPTLNNISQMAVVGIVGLLLALSVSLANNLLHETGERYYKIPVLGTQFQGKRARAYAIVSFTLFGLIAATVLQAELVALALRDPRWLSTMAGLLILFLLLNVNHHPDNWNVNDGRPLTKYALLLTFLLVIGPWVGPLLVSMAVEFVMGLWNRFVSWFTALVDSIISGIIHVIASNIAEIIVALLIVAIISLTKSRVEEKIP